MITEGTTNVDIQAPATATCKRGHTAQRDKDGNCIECRRETKRNAEAKRRARIKGARPTQLSRPGTSVTAPAPEAPHVSETTPAPARAGTFRAVAEEFMCGQDNLAPRTVTKRQYLLAQLSALYDRPIADLTTPEIVRALKAIEAAGDRRETAHRCAMFIGSITAYAQAHGYSPINALPSGTVSKAKVLKPIKTESHAAITDPQKFGGLLLAIEDYARLVRSRNHPSVFTALRLAPLIFLRPGELRQLTWDEVNFERAELLIGAERTKMRRPHLVPLSPQALAILKAQHERTGTGRYVFPQKSGKDKAISENCFREAFRMISLVVPDEFTMHGFRASASTLLNQELKVDSELIELQLAHRRGGVRGVYDRSERVEERRTMMIRWSDYLDELRAASARE